MPSRSPFWFFAQSWYAVKFNFACLGPLYVSFAYQMSPVEIVLERLEELELHSFIL